MVAFTLPLKPLSINDAFQGRRFKTRAAHAYDKALALLIPHRPEPGPYYAVTYRFFLRNFGGTDGDNLIKQLQDNLVKSGVLRDDRYIVDWRVSKRRAEVDRIEVEVESVAAPE